MRKFEVDFTLTVLGTIKIDAYSIEEAQNKVTSKNESILVDYVSHKEIEIDDVRELPDTEGVPIC